MKKIFFTLAAAGSLFAAQAQTAVDFTATDCGGSSHNLYTELNAGKIVVLTWVMPCSMCVSGGNAAQNAVQSFSTTNPGKVLFWMIDDLGDTPCASLTSWAISNGISKATMFENTGNAISESNFGGSGMPHVVVISPDKTILYNQKNGNANDQTGITNAIAQGLTATGISQIDPRQISIAPNPALTEVKLSYGVAIKEVTVLTVSGQVVMNEHFPSGKMNPSVSVSSLTPGMYEIVITDAGGRRGVQQFLKH